MSVKRLSLALSIILSLAYLANGWVSVWVSSRYCWLVACYGWASFSVSSGVIPPPGSDSWLSWDVNPHFILAWRIEPGPELPGVFCVSAPTWLPAVLAFALTSYLWRRDRKRRHPNSCAACGYNLTGNVSGICPECGTKVVTGPDQRQGVGRRILNVLRAGVTRKRVIAASVAVLILAAGYGGYELLRPRPDPNLVTFDNYQRLALGMPPSEALAVLGIPSGVVENSRGDGVRAAYFARSRMTFLGEESSTPERRFALTSEGASPIEWSEELRPDGPLSSCVSPRQYGEIVLKPSGISDWWRPESSWVYRSRGRFRYSNDGSTLLPARALYYRLKGYGMLWEGLYDRSISAVFEDGKLIYKSFRGSPR